MIRRKERVVLGLALIVALSILSNGCSSVPAPKATMVTSTEAAATQIKFAVTQWQDLRARGLVTPTTDAQAKGIYKKVYDTFQMVGKVEKQIIAAKTDIEKEGFQVTYNKLINQVMEGVTDILTLAASLAATPAPPPPPPKQEGGI
jgi:PBP1b-binding outer membrane lipoprotein LpoB